MTPGLEITILSLFPQMLEGFLSESIIGRAVREGLVRFESRNIRDWAPGKHAITDDRPFGGGAGMVLKPEPVAEAIKAVRKPESHVIYLCPDGELLTTKKVRELAKKTHLILLCGHYEGLDERIRECYVDEEISIGDYVLTNGVLPAAVLCDAVSRYIPGVLGEEQSLQQDSFSNGLLTFPQYTRPEVFEGMPVPEILLSGHHKKIDEWRQEQQKIRTQERRPDIWQKFQESTRS